MSTTKPAASSMLNHLPDDGSFEDIQFSPYISAKIRRRAVQEVRKRLLTQAEDKVLSIE